MFSIHEHLKKKRAPIDKWSIKEQLCLASAVVRSGDQNWTSVSRALKAFQDPNRPNDWFSQKNCAAQYGLLLDNVDTPKRKKRLTDKFSSSPEVVTETETTLELIKKKLTEERIQELHDKLQQNKREYQRVVYDTKLVKSGKATTDKVKQIYNDILERKKIEEKKHLEHVVWLKEREEKKLEMERQLRPGVKISTGVSSPSSLKFKEDILDTKEDISTPDTSKSTTSPLLTSLLKSPSPAPNPSLLHSSIASRGPSLPKSALLSSTNITHETENVQNIPIQRPTLPSSLETSNTTSLIKRTPIDPKGNLTNSVIQQASELISVSPALATKVDPQVDALSTDNIPDDILSLTMSSFGANEQTSLVSKEIFDDLSMDETLTEVDNIIRKEQEKEQLAMQLAQQGCSSSVTPTNNMDADSNSTNSEHGTEMSESDQIESRVEDIIQSISNDDELLDIAEEETKESTASADMESLEPDGSNDDTKIDSSDETVIESKSSRENESAPGSVEVVEVVLMEDEEEDGKKMSEDKKNLEMSQMVSDLRKECGLDKSIDERDENIEEIDEKSIEIEDSVSSETADTLSEKVEEDLEERILQDETTVETTSEVMEIATVISMANEKVDTKIECEPMIVLEKLENPEIHNPVNTEIKISSPVHENLDDTCDTLADTDDDSPIEVIKEDKHGKMKRDYSRKRMEDKPKLDDDDYELLTKKPDVSKFKRLDSDRRSESPWLDEEETISSRTRRPYSVSIDSPNSPASSITEDEKEYRIWKKSIFLVFNRLCTHRNSSLFTKPITNEQAPGYHNVIKRPMDLSTIKKNLDNGTLRTTSEFQRDVMLMFQNAIMYNKIGSTVYNMAKEMQKEGLEQLQFLVQAQTQDAPLRRETRTSEPSLKRKRGLEK